MSKSVRLYILMNIVAWIIFSLVDYIEETTANDFFLPAIIILSIIVCIIYCVFEIKTENFRLSFKHKAILKLIWIGITGVFAVPIFFLVCSDMWIIKQARGGWEHFLNGIEYGVMGFFLVVFCSLFFFIFDVGVWFYLRRQKNESL